MHSVRGINRGHIRSDENSDTCISASCCKEKSVFEQVICAGKLDLIDAYIGSINVYVNVCCDKA